MVATKVVCSSGVAVRGVKMKAYLSKNWQNYTNDTFRTGQVLVPGVRKHLGMLYDFQKLPGNMHQGRGGEK